jgi:hypothetical protein
MFDGSLLLRIEHGKERQSGAGHDHNSAATRHRPIQFVSVGATSRAARGSLVDRHRRFPAPHQSNVATIFGGVVVLSYAKPDGARRACLTPRFGIYPTATDHDFMLLPDAVEEPYVFQRQAGFALQASN